MKETRLFKVAFPIFIELLFLTIYGTVDTLMLSNYSKEAVGAVGIANTLFLLFAILINIIALGIGSVASQYVGNNQLQKAKDTIKTGTYATLFISTILFIALFFLRMPLLRLIGTDDSLFYDAERYLKWASISIIFLGLRVTLSTGYRVFSKSNAVMYIMVIGNILNMLLNVVLIYGFWFIPSLGAEGAAIGTLIARGITVGIFVYGSYKLLGMKLHRFVLNIDVLKKTVGVGLPSALENLGWNIAQVFIMRYVNDIGVDQMIARTYILNMMSYIFLLAFALATANGIIVGYHIGDKKPEEAYKQTFKTQTYAMLGTWPVIAVMILFGSLILRIYTQDAVVIKLASDVLWLIFFLETARANNLIFIAALRASGDTLIILIGGVSIMFALNVGLGFVFTYVLELGLMGILLAASLDEIGRALFNIRRFKSKKWMHIKLIEHIQT
jgi:putative MATE family efflux protein